MLDYLIRENGFPTWRSCHVIGNSFFLQRLNLEISMNLLKFLLVLIVCLAVSNRASAIDAKMQLNRGPFYVGQPEILTIHIENCEKEADPEWELLEELPEGVTLTLANVSPTSKSSTFIYNGRVVSNSSISYRMQFRIVGQKPGKFTVGPLQVSQNGESISTKQLEFEFREVEIDPEMMIDLDIPDVIYPGQQVPVTIRWGYVASQEKLNRLDLRSLRIHSTLFDQFSFEEEEVTRRDNYFFLQTSAGEVPVKYEQSTQEIDGQTYVVTTMKRTMVADKPGKTEFEPVSVSVPKILNWKRRDVFDDFSFFGNSRPRPGKTKPVRAIGKPFSIEVKPFPPGQPASFSGAIGTGYRLAVDVVGSTIVNVGDPIKIKISLQGKGNLKNASLPSLASAIGWDPKKFRLPTENLTGTVSGNTKEFTTTIRVNDTSVNQLPPFEFSWFDPEKHAYITTSSEPQSLTVGEAQLVTSNDVVSSPVNSDSSNSTSLPEDRASTANASKSLAGADLAIELNRTELMLRPSSAKPWLGYALYVVGLTAVGISFFAVKRNQRDPELTEQKRNLQARLGKLKTMTQNEGSIKEVASELRSLLPHADSSDRAKVENLLAEMETMIYAPQNQVDSATRVKMSRAAFEIAEGIVKSKR